MEPTERTKTCPTCGRPIDAAPLAAGETVTLTAPEGTIGAIGTSLEAEDSEKEASDSGSVL